MTAIKPSDHGIVVDHVESGVRFAVSDANYNVKVHRKVRDLEPGESVQSYRPRRKESLGAANDPNTQETAAGDAETDSDDAQ
jgi:hypothetical protein